MLLKVGDLAKRCGLTVRTLHHYDSIGLLKPSARSDSGYRLYNRADISRLHQIQALRRFGLSLAAIGDILANPGLNLATIVERQIDALDQQIAQSKALRDRLHGLQLQLTRGEEPELADWLTTLEMMTMYDKYFSANDLKRLPLLDIDETSTAGEWAALVKSVHEAMRAGLAPESAKAQTLATQWISMLVRDTQGDPRLLVKLNAMMYGEPSIQSKTGVTPELVAYVQSAFIETKLTIYEKYLAPDEFSFMRENYGKRTDDWPPLIAAICQHREDGTPPNDPRMQQLTRTWLELFRAYAGDNPDTHAKIRAAHQAEPYLFFGTFIDQPLLAYVYQAMSELHQAPIPGNGKA
ncbi:MerR family transcriptional regulator [Methylomonas montana]|uniref:MerR family transcriptional regulator n=1 Tax=Methylomonas montana TaxID=3058963 RepID=UPI002659AF9A|nr:MerR family transcriptional regulator [Methylomonas montana]WKJ90044.1 MerR family transcriptional regulator [Methylomonas montana]